MNVKNILGLAAIGLVATACNKVESVRDLDTCTDVVVCSTNNSDGSIFVSDLAEFETKLDITTSTYGLNIKNVQLFDGAPLRSAELSNLWQYYKEQDDEAKTPLYTMFRQESQTRQSGDLDVSSTLFNWLGSNKSSILVYWASWQALDGEYTCWALPRKFALYADKNTIKSYYGTNEENAIHPRYDITLDLNNSTISLKSQAVKYPVDKEDVSKSWEFRSMEWNNLPVKFHKENMTVEVEKFTPKCVDDKHPDLNYEISNFKMTLTPTFEGAKECSFIISNGQTSLTVNTTFAFTYE